MHAVTRWLAILDFIMVGAAITAFTAALKTPITADGFFTLRDVVEELVLPIAFAVANYRLYVHLKGSAVGRVSSTTQFLTILAELALLAGIVVASLAVGIRFVGDELTTNYCSGVADSPVWCQRAQLFHKELGHLGLFLGNILAASSLLICQLGRSDCDEPNRFDEASVGLLGGLCGIGLFALVVEGRIIQFGLPVLGTYALGTMVAWRARRGEIRRLPILRYQTIAAWFGLTLVAIWVVYWCGFPDFALASRALAR